MDAGPYGDHMSTTTHTLPSADTRWLDDLAHAVAEFGIARRENEIRSFAYELRCTMLDNAHDTSHDKSHGNVRVLLEVLADVAQPAAARERAFGRLHGIALAAPAALHLAAA